MMKRLLPLLPIGLLAGCEGIQTINDNAGHDSGLIRGLFVTFTIVTILFFAIVMAFLVAAYWRRGGKRQDGLPDVETCGMAGRNARGPDAASPCGNGRWG